MKRCAFCAEEIQDAAIKCRYCGSDLSAGEPRAASVQSVPQPQRGGSIGRVFGWIAAIIVVMVIIGFMLPEDPDLAAFKAKRAAWHQRCDQYVGRTVTNDPVANACQAELTEMLAEGKRRGW